MLPVQVLQLVLSLYQARHSLTYRKNRNDRQSASDHISPSMHSECAWQLHSPVSLYQQSGHLHVGEYWCYRYVCLWCSHHSVWCLFVHPRSYFMSYTRSLSSPSCNKLLDTISDSIAKTSSLLVVEESLSYYYFSPLSSGTWNFSNSCLVSASFIQSSKRWRAFLHDFFRYQSLILTS